MKVVCTIYVISDKSDSSTSKNKKPRLVAGDFEFLRKGRLEIDIADRVDFLFYFHQRLATDVPNL